MEKGAAMGSFEPVFEYVALVIDLVGISMILWGFSLSFKDWLILEMRKGETISFFRAPAKSDVGWEHTC
jgi:hypothetical protein